MCTDKNNDKNKINLPPPTFHSFRNYWKTATPTKAFKFSDFQFVFINVLWKFKRNCMIGLFCTANLLNVGRKKMFFKFHGF